jgi:hypothetical protein
MARGRIHRLFRDQAIGVGVVKSMVIDLMDANGSSPLGIEIVTTGTPSGVFTMEGSDQYDPDNNPTPTFIPTATAATPAFPVPAGAGAQTLHTFTPSASGNARWVRLVYTGSAGAGTLNAWAWVKSSG